MTHFNEELFTKVRNKEELYRNMEAMIHYLQENQITSDMLQADRTLFHHFSETVIYPYLCKAMQSYQNSWRIKDVLHMEPEEAANTIFITFCRRLDSLMKSIKKRPDLSMHQILNYAINNMIIDLARKEKRRMEDIQNDLFWEIDAGYTMNFDLSCNSEEYIAILHSAADMEKHHLLAFLGISAAGFTPKMLQDALNRKGNTAVLRALICYVNKKQQILISPKTDMKDPFENRCFTPKELSYLNAYAKRSIQKSLKKTYAKQK